MNLLRIVAYFINQEDAKSNQTDAYYGSDAAPKQIRKQFLLQELFLRRNLFELLLDVHVGIFLQGRRDDLRASIGLVHFTTCFHPNEDNGEYASA